jgi:DNA-binding transcriptional MerR regulator
MTLTVSEVAASAGLSPDAVRYYERVGLLPKANRTAAGYRMYEESTADRIRFIKGAQRLGLSLDEIRELLEVADRGLCPCGHARILLEERIAHCDRELARLRRVRRELSLMLERTPTAQECPPEAGPERWQGEGELIKLGRRGRGS